MSGVVVNLKRLRIDQGARKVWLRVRQSAFHGCWISAFVTFLLFGLSEGFVRFPWAHWLYVSGEIVEWIFLAALATWIVALLGSWWSLGRYRWGILTPALRREGLEARFEEVASWARSHGLVLVRVVMIYQHGARGTKCLVEFTSGERQDAWFWRAVPKRNGVYAVQGSRGHGVHNNLNVLYVGDPLMGSGIRAMIPGSVWKANLRSFLLVH